MDVRFPIGQLEVPEKVTVENVQEWLKEIEAYTVQLRETVDTLTDEELSRTYREGAWTVPTCASHCRFTVEHVSTVEASINR